MTRGYIGVLRFMLVAALMVPGTSGQAERVRLPRKIGQCVVTTIKEIGDRFGGPLNTISPDVGAGTLVTFGNGGVQVSYQWESVIARSHVGDKVRMCLTEIPDGCPPGDTRGKVYTTTNLRSGEAWSLPDSQHMCGGA